MCSQSNPGFIRPSLPSPHSGGIFRYQRQVYERQMITLIMICRQQASRVRKEGVEMGGVGDFITCVSGGHVFSGVAEISNMLL